MGVDNAALLDLMATTLEDLPKGQFEVMWDNQDYTFARIYNQARRKIDGGTSIQRNVVLDETGAATYRRLYDTDNPAVNQIHHQINVAWCQIGTNYSWDVVEILRNKNSVKGYIDLMESRRMEGLWSYANLFEDRGWKTPTNATDTLYPNGVPYYLNMANNGVTAGGFVGQTIRYQDGSTGTACSGIDAATEAKWRNYADIYTKVDNGLLKKMRKAMLLTRFKPPQGIKAPGQDAPGANRGIYVDADRSVEFMDLSDKRDDNNAPKELAGKTLVDIDGATFFNRVPVCYVPQLDGAAFQPIYCVDWSKIQPVVQDGYWMNEGKPMMDRTQHTTVTVFVDSAHNNLCINRRTAGWVMHLVTS